MLSETRQAIRDEVNLVQRFTQTYRAKLAGMIDRLNSPSIAPLEANPDQQSIRWCVEAVDMVLASQAEFAKALDRLAAAGN